MTEYKVEVQPDFLERQAKAQPIAAVAELIWNGLPLSHCAKANRPAAGPKRALSSSTQRMRLIERTSSG
jgi:hypothetical protein